MSHLTQEQRYAIEVLLKQNFSISFIARTLLRDKSVICREIKRNSDKRSGKYKSDLAQRKSEVRKRNKRKSIKFSPCLQERVRNLLIEDYSPEQIVGYCKDQGFFCVSIECIYQYIWLDKKQGGSLYLHLRTRGKRYRKRGSSKDSRGILKDRISIRDRPEIVQQKTRFGDFEVDTIIGKNHQGAIVTINDRATGLLRMRKVTTKDAFSVKNTIIDLLEEFKTYRRTITSDNGKEFAMHKEIKEELMIEFYFADPYSPWQRGANENLNGLIRQYIPKSSSLENITHNQIYQIQEKINNRPRKRYNFKSPIQMLNNLLHL